MDTIGQSPNPEKTTWDKISNIGRLALELVKHADINAGEAGLRSEALAKARQDNIAQRNNKTIR